MTSRDFCYWLQGYFELCDLNLNAEPSLVLTKDQVKVMRNHLNMVFKHEIDPSMGDQKHQGELSKIHLDLDAMKHLDASGIGKINC